MSSWRSGNTHGFCVTGGHSPIASEPTPSRRLWQAAPGANPALRIEHTTGGRGGHSKPERSTLLESGTFYFALTAAVAVDIGLDGGGGGGVGFGEDDNLIARHGLESFADVGMATVLVGGIPEVDALVEGGAEELGDSVVAQFTGLV